jgi:autotransporter-associated beta strand protein
MHLAHKDLWSKPTPCPRDAQPAAHHVRIPRRVKLAVRDEPVNHRFDLRGRADALSAMTALAGGSISGGTVEATYAFDLYLGIISSNLSGTGRVNKLGPGTVTLWGWNDYTGGTHLYDGELDIAGAHSLPPGTMIIFGD